MSDALPNTTIVGGGSRVTEPERAYGIHPDVVVNLNDMLPTNDPEISTHRHVVIKWAGGEVWLDMADLSNETKFGNPHFCIDMRQFNPEGNMKGQGVFTIVNGSRQVLGEASIASTHPKVLSGEVRGGWITYKMPPLPDKEGTPVQAHGYNGGYVITMLTDAYGSEAAMAPANSQGNG